MGGSGEGGGGQGSDVRRTHYALSVDEVRHVGEAVAAVVATSPAAAVDAAAAVIVDWEPLPAVIDMRRAADPDAPLVFAGTESNVDHVWRRKHGDPDAAFASAYRVVRQAMTNQRLAGVPMEGRAVAAAPDLATGGLTIWTSTQAAHWIRRDAAKVLGLAENQIRVIAPDVGGGFGVKIGLYPEEILLAALARSLRLPLRWI
jgi:carbon-monoxide dehydrogenase large subunit